MNVFETKKLIKNLTLEGMRQVRIPYEVEFSNRLRRAICSTHEKRFMGKPIQYKFVWNNKVVNEFKDNIELIKGILYHELAHAIVGNCHNHDRVWQAKARELGGFDTTKINLEDYRK